MLVRVRLSITGIIGSLTSRVFETARAAGRGKIRAAGAGDGRSWYVMVSGAALELRIERTGGTVGWSQSAGGGVGRL